MKSQKLALVVIFFVTLFGVFGLTLLVEVVPGLNALSTKLVRSLVVAVLVAVIAWARYKIKHLRRDATTKLYRRLVADERMEYLARVGQDVTVALIDINGLKITNDTRGYHEGDELLKEVANRLAPLGDHRSRLVARMGGDEFVVIASGTTTHRLRDEVMAALSPPHRFGPWPAASVGVARARKGSRDAYRCADLAMKRAKKYYYATGECAGYVYCKELDQMPAPYPVDSKFRPHTRIRDMGRKFK